MASKRLDLIRHGQTALNREKRFRGRVDAPLTEGGRREVRGAGYLLEESPPDVIFTSPLPRAVQTAEIVAEIAGCGVEAAESFIDVDYGEWAGLTVEEVKERFGADSMRSWIEDPGGFRFPQGERMGDVRERLEPAIRGLVTAGYEEVAIVSHLAVLKTCFLVLMDLDFSCFWRLDLDNGSVSQFEHTPEEGFVLGFWNRIWPGTKPAPPVNAEFDE